MNFPPKMIEILCCPSRLCRGDLEYAKSNDKEWLRCVECGAEYSIVHGIPILFPNAEYAEELHGRHWDQEMNAKSYSDKYEKNLAKQGTPWGQYTHQSEIEAVDALLDDVDLSGKYILDCGCGNGRFLRLHSEASVRIGLDASLVLLVETKKRVPDLWLACGQIEDMPFKDASVDFSISIRVFQHLYAPEQAFSSMVRVTKPSGHVCLEVYNSLNLKELWKKFRMLSWVEKLRPWGLNYDAYYSYRDYEKWAGDNFVSINKFSGAGWGFHFYILEMIHFRHLFPKFLQEGVFKGSLAIERVIRTMPFFSKTLEKVCMIGSVQKRKQKTGPLLNITDRLKTRNSRKIADRLICTLESRNFAFMGSDMHHLRQTVDWLKRAQDATPDGGVSRGYSLLWNSRYRKAGWQPSYPETTGYIIPTMLKAATVLNDDGLVGRVKQMARWEMSIALPGGAVMGGNVSEIPKSALFDTGQVIRGFHALAKETGDSRYLDKAKEASRFIMNCEDGKSGHWMSNAAIQVDPESTTYYAYAVSPIVELGVEMDDAEMMDLGRRTGEHALAMQNEAGWVEQCCFTKAPDCLLHTLAYTFDGLWDMGKALGEEAFIQGAMKGVNGVLNQMDDRGFVPGRFDSAWNGTVDWACLTGIAQIGVTCLKEYGRTGDSSYLDAARKGAQFLKSCQCNFDIAGVPRGSVWGSWPVAGGYAPYQALNWAAKYFADLLMLLIEAESRGSSE